MVYRCVRKENHEHVEQRRWQPARGQPFRSCAVTIYTTKPLARRHHVASTCGGGSKGRPNRDRCCSHKSSRHPILRGVSAEVEIRRTSAAAKGRIRASGIASFLRSGFYRRCLLRYPPSVSSRKRT